MKLRKLFLSAATGCLLVGASGAAMAQAVDCADGPIIAVTVEAITSTGSDCEVKKSTILGDVTINNSDGDVTTFVDNIVEGRLQIRGGRASVLVNTLKGVELPHRVNAARISIVGANIVLGSLAVNNNGLALVDNNVVGGNLRCIGNFELETDGENHVGGRENCADPGDL